MMAFRLLRYMVRIWERWLDDHKRSELLPAIVPVVLYHGSEPWSAPMTFDAMLDIPTAMQPALAPFLVHFSYLLDDLSEIPDDQLRARAMSALGRLVTLCFKHARTRADMLDLLISWTDVVREVFRAANGLEELDLVMRYILQVNDRVKDKDLGAVLERQIGPAAKDIIMTAGERLIQQGEERGIRKILLRQLRHRFGSQVNAEAEQRLANATEDQLDVWADRVLSAPTLAELLAD